MLFMESNCFKFGLSFSRVVLCNESKISEENTRITGIAFKHLHQKGCLLICVIMQA